MATQEINKKNLRAFRLSRTFAVVATILAFGYAFSANAYPAMFFGLIALGCCYACVVLGTPEGSDNGNS